MKIQFNEIYLSLTLKERLAILYAVRMYNHKYSNLHMGQVSFLTLDTVKFHLGQLLHEILIFEENKLKPPISKKICKLVIEKLKIESNTQLVHLDELKVYNKSRKLLGTDILVVYVPICDGRISCRCELRFLKKNMFYLTTKQTYLVEAIQQVTYKFGLWNKQ